MRSRVRQRGLEPGLVIRGRERIKPIATFSLPLEIIRDLRQIPGPCAALVIQSWGLLAATIRHDLVRPLEHLGLNAVALNPPTEMVPTPTAALDVKHVEQDDGAFRRYEAW